MIKDFPGIYVLVKSRQSQFSNDKDLLKKKTISNIFSSIMAGCCWHKKDSNVFLGIDQWESQIREQMSCPEIS